MTRILILASLACCLMGAAKGTKGKLEIQARPDQTTASTKMLVVKNAAGTEKLSCDIEGDVIVAGTLSVTGALTAGSATYSGSNFDTDLTVATNLFKIEADDGSLSLGSGLNDFTVSAAGNMVAAGTCTCGGVTTSTGNLIVGSNAVVVTAATGATAVASTLKVAGAISGPVELISASSGTTALTVAQSGALVANTGTSGTTTFTLPSAAAGLRFCFVEAGDAAGELLINPYGAAGDVIVGKTHGAENGAGIATAANSGIKNTAATNVKGDATCLVALDTTTWVMTSVAGVWSAQ